MPLSMSVSDLKQYSCALLLISIYITEELLVVSSCLQMKSFNYLDVSSYMSGLVRKPVFGVSDLADTNQAVQP